MNDCGEIGKVKCHRNGHNKATRLIEHSPGEVMIATDYRRDAGRANDGNYCYDHTPSFVSCLRTSSVLLRPVRSPEGPASFTMMQICQTHYRQVPSGMNANKISVSGVNHRYVLIVCVAKSKRRGWLGMASCVTFPGRKGSVGGTALLRASQSRPPVA